MKKLLALLFVLSMNTALLAQAPESFQYQAVARDAAGTVLANQNVSFRINILETSAAGTSVYEETHTVTTNGFGLANLAIGGGTVVSGTFSTIAWDNDLHFVQVEMDEAGGTNYQMMGTSQLLSVPYALHAKTVENDQVDDADADPNNELITNATLNGTDLEITDAGGTSTVDLSSLSSGTGSPTTLEIRKLFMASAGNDMVNEPWIHIYTNGTNGELVVEVPATANASARVSYSTNYGTPTASTVAVGTSITLTGLSAVSLNLSAAEYSNIGPGGVLTFTGIGMVNGWIIGHVMYE